jgi:hypothetical protein
MTYTYRELPFDDEDSHAEAAGLIINGTGLDLDKNQAYVVMLLRRTRYAHRMLLSGHMRRNDPEWQVPRARPRGRGPYDYGDMAGMGMDDWDEWWTSIWGRLRGNPGRFRGSDVPKAPLLAIYYMCNRFWRYTQHQAFWPDFRKAEAYATDADAIPDLNPAARFFLLVAQDADRKYNCDLCARVHDANYRSLNTHIP